MTEPDVLRIVDLRKSFGKVIAVDGFSLEVPFGETVVITGPSGCGKSTVLRCINRLVEPDSGEIWLDNINILRLPYRELLGVRRRIGFVFQNSNLIRRLSVLDNVMLGPLLTGTPERLARRKATLALERVHLTGRVLMRRPQELSGGEQQRVAIARALAMEPEVILWDEPTAALDPILVSEVLDIMEELVRDSTATMIIVTHELGFALRVADRMVLMEAGKIKEEGVPEEILSHPKSEIGRRYARLFDTRFEFCRGRAGNFKVM